MLCAASRFSSALDPRVREALQVRANLMSDRVSNAAVRILPALPARASRRVRAWVAAWEGLLLAFRQSLLDDPVRAALGAVQVSVISTGLKKVR